MRVLALLAILLGTFAQARADQPVRLLNYNVGLLRMPGLGDLVASVDFRARALPEALRGFVNANHPDIILLEEAWEQGHQNTIKQELTSLGYEVEIPVGARAPVNFLNPLSLLDVGYNGSSAFVVAWNKRTVELQSQVKMDSYSAHGILGKYDQGTGKGIVSAHMRFKTSKIPFLFIGAYSTALDVEPATGKALNNEDGRALESANAKQMQLVVDTAGKEVLPTEKAIIVMGDFNVGHGIGDSNFDILRGGLETEPLIPQNGVSWDRNNELVKTGRYPNDPSATIDHIFVKTIGGTAFVAERTNLVFAELITERAADMAVIQQLPLSDHYGIFVQGRIK